MQAPKPSPFAHKAVDSLPEMLLMYGSQAASILYYEVLDLPLPELEKLKIVKVGKLCSTKNLVASGSPYSRSATCGAECTICKHTVNGIMHGH